MRNYNQQIVIKIGKFAREILEIVTNINLFTCYVYTYKNSSICSKHMKNYCQYKREIVLFAHVTNLRFIDHASNYSRLKITWQKGKKNGWNTRGETVLGGSRRSEEGEKRCRGRDRYPDILAHAWNQCLLASLRAGHHIAADGITDELGKDSIMSLW